MHQIDRNKIQEFFNGAGKDLYDSCLNTVKKFGMTSLIESGVLVGFSGGADSMLLLCFLLEYQRRSSKNFAVLPVHINHGIRGDEALRDQTFCSEVCSMLNLPIEIRKFSVPDIANETNMGTEEVARNVRYFAFAEIKRGRSDIASIAVAHNLSDNAETVLFNILRGSGTRGGAGIRAIRDDIIRPLIKISKSEIVSALDGFGIPYVVDSSNNSTDYTRNFIRHEIIPKLQRVSSNPELMISRFSDNLRSDNDFIESFAKDLLDENIQAKSSDLLSAHYSVYIRTLSLMAESLGCSISSKIASDIRELLCKDNFSYSIIGGAFVCERGICKVSIDPEESKEFFYPIQFGINRPCDDYELIISEENCFANVYNYSINANLSSAIIDGDLYLRSKKDGDTIYYGGMTHKLKKLFNDRKIPLSERKKLPILCDQKGVLWVPGFGVRDDNISPEERKNTFVTLGYLSDRSR